MSVLLQSWEIKLMLFESWAKQQAGWDFATREQCLKYLKRLFDTQYLIENSEYALRFESHYSKQT